MTITVEAVSENDKKASTAVRKVRTPAEILAEIASFTVESGLPETGSIDHDKILYGTKDEE